MAACDFQWYQCQWKQDMRNRTLWGSKKIELGFEISLPINETQFSKEAITKNDIFLLNLMLILVNTNRNQHRENRYVL